MKYEVEIEGRTVQIEFEQSGDKINATIDGTPYEATLLSPETGVYTLFIAGKVYELTVSASGESLTIAVAGERMSARVIDRKHARRKHGLGGAGVETLCAPMPGRVVQLLKAAGDAVQPGEGIVVIEAMKMQNELSASKAGTVVEVKVNVGQTVGTGDVLAVIE